MKFVKDIRKLGVNDTNKSYLDQFRILITEIGAGLCYVCIQYTNGIVYPWIIHKNTDTSILKLVAISY